MLYHLWNKLLVVGQVSSLIYNLSLNMESQVGQYEIFNQQKYLCQHRLLRKMSVDKMFGYGVQIFLVVKYIGLNGSLG